MLKISERFLFSSVPMPRLVLMKERSHGLCQVLESWHKALIEATESKETSNILDILGNGPSSNCFKLAGVGSNATMPNDKSDVINLALGKGAFRTFSKTLTS